MVGTEGVFSGVPTFAIPRFFHRLRQPALGVLIRRADYRLTRMRRWHSFLEQKLVAGGLLVDWSRVSRSGPTRTSTQCIRTRTPIIRNLAETKPESPYGALSVRCSLSLRWSSVRSARCAHCPLSFSGWRRC